MQPFHLLSIDSAESQADMASLETIALAVLEHLTQGGKVEELSALCAGLQLHNQVRMTLEFCAEQGASEGQALLLMASWTNSRTDGIGSALITSTLQPHVESLAALQDRCLVFFEAFLSGYAIDRWSTPARALSAPDPAG